MTNIPSSKPDPALKQLHPMVGEWKMVGRHPAFPGSVNGHSSFKWMERGSLLVWNFDWENPGPPSATCVIGHDDESESYSILYTDERGVARIYLLTLEERIWTMHRESPDFSQRMTWSFSEDGNTIKVQGELSRDGSTWEGDLNVVYTRET